MSGATLQPRIPMMECGAFIVLFVFFNYNFHPKVWSRQFFFVNLHNKIEKITYIVITNINCL